MAHVDSWKHILTDIHNIFKNLCFLINEAISKNEYLFNILELNMNIKTILYIILKGSLNRTIWHRLTMLFPGNMVY